MRHYLVDGSRTLFPHEVDELSKTTHDVGMLASFFYYESYPFHTIPAGVDLILDSGGFSAWSLGKTVSIDAYAAWLQAMPYTYTFAFNLDVIGDAEGSLRQWLQLRDMGCNTVPVIHYGDDPARVFPGYLRHGQVDRVAISGGAMRGVAISQRLRWQALVFRYLRDHDLADLKVHGLGVHMKSRLAALPWATIDSSSFTAAWRFGILDLWNPFSKKWLKVAMDRREIHRYGRLLRWYGVHPSEVEESTPQTRPALVRLATRIQIQATRDFNTRRGHTTRYYMAEASLRNFPTQIEELGTR